MVKNKIVGFRPTDIEQQKLKEYMAAHGIEKSSIAIRAMAFLMPKSLPSSMEKPVKIQEGKTKTLIHEVLYLPPTSPDLKREIKRFLRGQHSELVKALLAIDQDSLNRAFTCATPKGILTLIPTSSMHAIPSTTTLDTKGGLA